MQQDEIPVPARRGHPVLFGLGALILIFTLYTLGQLIVIRMTGGTQPLLSPKLLPYLFGATQLLLMFVPALLLARTRPEGIAGTLRFRPVHFSVYVAVALGVVALNPVLEACLITQELYLIPASWLEAYHQLEHQADDLYSLVLKSGGPGIALSLLVGAVIPALSEESFFRGLVQGSFERRLHPGLAIFLASFLFGLVHFQITSVVLMIVGGFLGYVAWSSGSIYPTMLGHALFNTIAIVAINSPLGDRSGAVPRPEDLIAVLPMAGIGLVIVICAVLWLRMVRRTAQEQAPEYGHSTTLDEHSNEQ
jgi:membrane protease YdiL (CAAX protease family)